MRRVDHYRSRRAVLWGAAVFAGLQLGFSALIAFWWPELRDPLFFDKAAPLKARTVGVHPRPLTVLTLGTSRMDVGIRSKLMEDEARGQIDLPIVVYNFGMSGAGPVSRLIFLRRLLASGVRPDLVLVEVMPVTLTTQVEKHEFSRLPGARLSWDELDVVRRFGGPAEEAAEAWRVSWLVPWYQHRFVLLAKFNPRALAQSLQTDLFKGIDQWGQRPDLIRALTPEQHRSGIEHAHKDFFGRILSKPFVLSPVITEAYREILRSCREQHIEAMLVCMPEGPTFRSWYAPETQKQIDGFLSEVSREFDVPVVNAADWNDEADFRDSHHLILPGAEKFSRRLGREVLQPWMRCRLRTREEPLRADGPQEVAP